MDRYSKFIVKEKERELERDKEKEKEVVQKEKEKTYIHWTMDMDRCLTGCLLEQQCLGNKAINGWKGSAFTAAINALKDDCNVTVNKEKVLSRLKTWSKYYQEVSAMLNTSGFGWDWDRNIVKVDSEDVWADYVKAHPAVKHYRDKVIVNWADLGTICGCDKATGSNAATGNETANAIDLDDSGGEESYSCGKRVKYSTGSQSSRKKNPTSADILADAVSSIARSLSKAYESNSINATLTHASTAPTSTPTPMETSTKIWDELGMIPEPALTEKLKAMDLLIKDPLKYAVFMTIPSDVRKIWLLMQFKD